MTNVDAILENLEREALLSTIKLSLYPEEDEYDCPWIYELLEAVECKWNCTQCKKSFYDKLNEKYKEEVKEVERRHNECKAKKNI